MFGVSEDPTQSVMWRAVTEAAGTEVPAGLESQQNWWILEWWRKAACFAEMQILGAPDKY